MEIVRTIDAHINNGSLLTLPLSTEEVETLPEPTSIEITGKTMWLYIKGRVGRPRELRYFQNLKEDFPTIYNLLVYELFIKRLCRRMDSLEKEGFPIRIIDINSGKNNVYIEKNTLSDSRISIAGLAYIDFFVTRDQGQATLIKSLYPGYKDKVILRN